MQTMECLKTSIGLVNSLCTCLASAWSAKEYTKHDTVMHEGKFYKLDTTTTLPFTSSDITSESEWIDLSKSDSGVYLSDRITDWYTYLKSTNCDMGDFAQQALRAREVAVRTVVTDVMSMVRERTDNHVKPFNGQFGRTDGSGTFDPEKTYAGIEILPKNFMENYIKIEKVGLR
jgi:hypothetical protein